MTFDPVQRHLFLEGLYLKYGYDFRQYSEASLTRRLEVILRKAEMDDLLDVLKLALADREFFHRILPWLTVGTTEPFRDPGVFKGLREKVLPILATHPRLNIWVAGCSTGLEVYSLAIMLAEEGLLDRSVIYATDINTQALKTASDGIYDLATMQSFTRNYIAAGGTKSPSDYYTADYGSARFNPSLLDNVVFSNHNLVTDGVFVEAHLVTCRNVMIYFNRDLQNRALELFSSSLGFRGFLCLGSKETVRFSSVNEDFEYFDPENKIFRQKAEFAISPHPSREAR